MPVLAGGILIDFASFTLISAKMSIKEIQEYIKTYIRFNHPKEEELIPYRNIFGDNYDSKLLHEIIGKELSSITIGDLKYHLCSWSIDDSLFYVITRNNASSTK